MWYWHRKSNLSSGTGTRLSFGSIVQKGKFSAAAWLFVNTLKNVDFLQTRWNSLNPFSIRSIRKRKKKRLKKKPSFNPSFRKWKNLKSIIVYKLFPSCTLHQKYNGKTGVQSPLKLNGSWVPNPHLHLWKFPPDVRATCTQLPKKKKKTVHQGYQVLLTCWVRSGPQSSFWAKPSQQHTAAVAALVSAQGTAQLWFCTHALCQSQDCCCCHITCVTVIAWLQHGVATESVAEELGLQQWWWEKWSKGNQGCISPHLSSYHQHPHPPGLRGPGLYISSLLPAMPPNFQWPPGNLADQIWVCRPCLTPLE